MSPTVGKFRREPPDRICVYCGITFKPVVGRQRCCSRACYDVANADRQRAAASWRYLRNRERARTRMRAWYLANREAQIERARQWRRANPELHQLQNAARRARLMSGKGAAIEHREVIEGLPRACAYCGRSDVTLTVDHRVALSRGGLHELTNLAWACGPCNSRKAARDELEFRGLLALEQFISGRRRIEEASAPWRYRSRSRICPESWSTLGIAGTIA